MSESQAQLNAAQKWTPGDWEIHGKSILSMQGRSRCVKVAECDNNPVYVSDEEAFANLSLFMASRDMYAALEAMLRDDQFIREQLAEKTGITHTVHDGRQRALAALKKARGEA